MSYENYVELARWLLIREVKAPFSSPVAGSGKPFLPSLTLPATGTFYLKIPDHKKGWVFLNLEYPEPEPEILEFDQVFSQTPNSSVNFPVTEEFRVLDIGLPFP